MIHPQMATMLCFITTDAAVAPALLQEALVGRGRGDLQHHHRRRRHVDQRHGHRARQRRARARRDRARRTPGSRSFEAALTGLLRGARARDRRRRRGGDEAAGRRRRGRADARDGARSGPRGRRGQPDQVGHLRRRSVVGPDPGRARRPHRRARLPDRPGRRHARHPGHARLREAAGRSRSTRPICRRACTKSEIAVRLDLGAGDASARVSRLRPDLRLREDQRRVLRAGGGAAPRRRGRHARAPAASTARWSSRRLSYIRKFARQARGHQVRRRGHGRPGARSAASPRRSCCCSRRACAR